MQPEELTALLNEYLTEMSAIALQHGGTVDKFIGDAILGFFGDPETKGVAEDAKACVRMAIDMQQRLGELNVKWRGEGIDHPFARGWASTPATATSAISAATTAWTTPSSAPRRTSRRGCRSIAEPGSIVMSYETYSLVATWWRRPLPRDHHEGHQPRSRAVRGRRAGQRRKRLVHAGTNLPPD